jgi:hypothetical protein
LNFLRFFRGISIRVSGSLFLYSAAVSLITTGIVLHQRDAGDVP